MWVGNYVLNYGSVMTPEAVRAAIQAVQAEDIQKLADTIFRERTASMAWLSPGTAAKDGERFKALLAEM